MTYKPSQKYGLGRRNSHKIHTQSESDHLQSNLQDLDANNDCTEIGIAKQPILIIFNPKTIQISAEELNARNIWTSKLTGLQLGATFLKEYDVNLAVERITQEELEAPNPKLYDKQIICFSFIRGGILTEVLTALENYSPDTIITIGIHTQDIHLIKDEAARINLNSTFIIAASGTYLSSLEAQWSILEQKVKEAERQLKVAKRKLETIKHGLQKNPTSKSLQSNLGEQQTEVQTIIQHLDEFSRMRSHYVTFDEKVDEDEDSIVKRIRNLYRVWQGELVKRENMENEHGVIDKEQVRTSYEKRQQDRLLKTQEQQEKVKQAHEKRRLEAEEEKIKKEAERPRLWGMRIY